VTRICLYFYLIYYNKHQHDERAWAWLAISGGGQFQINNLVYLKEKPFLGSKAGGPAKVAGNGALALIAPTPTLAARGAQSTHLSYFFRCQIVVWYSEHLLAQISTIGI